MKIGILTQPIHTNYGGILQAFALQTVLTRWGHEVYIVNRDNRTLMWLLIHRCIRFLCDMIGRDYILPMNNELRLLQSEQRSFIEKELHLTSRVNTTRSLKKLCQSLNLQGYIVGSDQVWRPDYSPNIGNYFLDFVSSRQVFRVAYAASFGIENWTFSPSETKRSKELLRLFDGISVREHSAVELCNRFLDVRAELVLDPTMLLDIDDYEKHCIESFSSGELFCYFLDENEIKRQLISCVCAQTGLRHYFCMPAQKATTRNMRTNLDECIFPSVEKWLSSFKNARMIVTDSFHGCVFSIIFNKPFWACGNKARGNSRFLSLLSLFGLEKRLIDLNEITDFDFNAPIDWETVNIRRKEMQVSSLRFLSVSLQKS